MQAWRKLDSTAHTFGAILRPRRCARPINIMKLRIAVGLLLIGFCASGPGLRAADATETPDFKEIYDLLRANLAGADESELNRAAVQGLLSQLPARAALLGQPKGAESSPGSEPGIRSGVFDVSYGYLRIGQIRTGTDKPVLAAYQQLSSSNRRKGMIFDLA